MKYFYNLVVFALFPNLLFTTQAHKQLTITMGSEKVE